MTDDNDRSPERAARDAAIDWWVASRAGFTRAETTAFEAWRAADPANAAAYADIERTYAQARRVRRARRERPRRKRGKALAAGAAFAAAAMLAFVALDPALIALRSDFATATGETRSVTLADGSNVTLDARSAIAVRYVDDERRVSLLRGEAWFEVAKDAARPFVVEAGGGTVTALGTAFDVDLGGNGVRVGVGEHAVRVASAQETVVVGEGQQTSYAAQSPPASPSPAPRSLAAWRRGNLIFEDRPLGEVLAALGRYRRGFVYCAAAAICARPVTAVFSADNPAQALREIELFLGLRSVRFTDFLVVLYE